MDDHRMETGNSVFRLMSWKLAHTNNKRKKPTHMERDDIHITSRKVGIGYTGG